MSEGIGILIAVMISIGLFTILLLLFKENNPLLRLIFVAGILVSGFFIPTGVYQLRTECETVVANSTKLSNVTISYEYESFCYTTTSTAPETFYTVMWSLYQLMIVYVIIYVIVLMFTPVWERLKRW